MSNDDFNDDLSDMLGGKGPVATPKQPPASYIPLADLERRSRQRVCQVAH